MTEQDLIQLGFTREDETIESSGSPNDWHYYTYDIAGVCLITPASDEIENDEWYAEVFESPEIRFTDASEVKLFIDVLNRNKR